MINIYAINNLEYFNELVELTKLHPRSYFNHLKAKYSKVYNKSFNYLFDWMLNVTSNKLNINKHGISTITYWILNGIVDFPFC